MPQLDLRLFGQFELRTAADQALPVPARKTRAVLAYLALAPGRRATRDRLAALLEDGDLASEPLFRILADRTRAPDDALPATGIPLAWERMLSAAFIVSPQYGTRVSTVVRMTDRGFVEFEERRFDADGVCVGEQQFEFGTGD